jgi:hypothetical protein
MQILKVLLKEEMIKFQVTTLLINRANSFTHYVMYLGADIAEGRVFCWWFPYNNNNNNISSRGLLGCDAV